MQHYLPYLFVQARKRDLPSELALLAGVENALDPDAFHPMVTAHFGIYAPHI